MEDGLDTLGADDEVGFDWGKLLQTTGGVAQYGVSAYEEEKQAKASKAEDEKKTREILAADVAAAQALARAAHSAETKAPSAAIDAQAAQMAVVAQDRAAAGLSANAQKKRAEAADSGVSSAIKAAQARPTDKYLTALVEAWKLVASKAHAGAIVASGSGFDSYGQQSWFTRPVVGALPGWGVLAVGAGLLGVGWLAVKKFVFKK